MRSGDAREVRVPRGESYGSDPGPASEHAAEYLGRGTFCVAYRRRDSGRVLCYVRDCYAKEALAGLREEVESGELLHVPAITKLGWVQRITPRGRYIDTEGWDVYEMPFYPKLEARAHPDAWKWYRLLHDAREDADKRLREKHGWGYRLSVYGCDLNAMVADLLDAFECPDSLRHAVREINDAVANYGSGYTYDSVQPRNLGVDGEGRLVLRDVIFSAELIEQRYAARVIRARRF